jgi:hypothetical protein
MLEVLLCTGISSSEELWGGGVVDMVGLGDGGVVGVDGWQQGLAS